MKRILLAEDNKGDVQLVRLALAEHGVQHELHVAHDGEQATALLAGTDPSEEGCFDLVLLDLNLPRVDGPQILSLLRRHPCCGQTPVIVVSSSNAPTDRTRISELGIDHYFQKPSDLEEFMKLGEVVQQVLAYR